MGKGERSIQLVGNERVNPVVKWELVRTGCAPLRGYQRELHTIFRDYCSEALDNGKNVCMKRVGDRIVAKFNGQIAAELYQV